MLVLGPYGPYLYGESPAQKLRGLKEENMWRSLPKISRILPFLVTLLGLTLWTFLLSPSASAAPTLDATLVEQTVLIHFTKNSTESERNALIAGIQGEVVRWMPQIGVAEVRLPGSTDGATKGNAADVVQRRLSTLGRSAAVAEYVENDVVVEGAYVPNDPDVSNQQRTYPLQLTQAITGWDYTRGSNAIVIAVLDSGITLNHPEFQGRLLPGYDFVNADDDPSDDHGHGTHTAGIIAAGIDNGLGMVGVCPGCSLLPVKVLNQNNAGTWSGVAEGILFATDHGARVISLSLGAAVSSKTLEAAVSYAIEHNVLIVAAAGNMGIDRKFYPAALDGVMAVSATDANDARWVLSNMGDYIDIAAPGHAVYSTYNDLQNYYGGYNYMSGTSMAAPHVAGLAGLLLSQKPERTIADLYQIITTTADKLSEGDRDPYVGYGRINVARALAFDADTSTAPAAGGEQQTPNEPVTPSEPATTSEQLTQHVYLPLTYKP